MYILKIETLCHSFCLQRIGLLLFLDQCVKLLKNAIKLKNAG